MIKYICKSFSEVEDLIYFVEDDANIRKLVCYALEKEGYEIKGYSLPSEFWQELKNNKPQLVLLDIMLPEEDGLSILGKLQADDATKNIPVIMITAKGSEFDKVKGELISAIENKAANAEALIDLLMIAKYFERIGDHAENIAEWVIYSITGKHAQDN